jgi:hypothetical protein
MKKVTVVFEERTLAGLDELAAKVGGSRSSVIRSLLSGTDRADSKELTRYLAEFKKEVFAHFDALEMLMVQLLEHQARVPYFVEFVERVKAEGSIPEGGDTLSKGLWFASRYHNEFGVWPMPGDRGFPPMKHEDAAAWPSKPPA